MKTFNFQSPAEIQNNLSHRLRELRLDRGLSQEELAAKASISRRAVRALESGARSSVTSLIRALHAMGAAGPVDIIAPRAPISPIQILRSQTERFRVRRPRRKRTFVTMEAVEVRIWGQNVGVVAADPQSRAYRFEYYPEWIAKGVELAPLMMPLRADQPSWIFPDAGEGFSSLPGLLADALPDAFGNLLIQTWMIAHGVAQSEITAIDRLAYMAKRGMGALEFRPALGSRTESAKPLEMSVLVGKKPGAPYGWRSRLARQRRRQPQGNHPGRHLCGRRASESSYRLESLQQ